MTTTRMIYRVLRAHWFFLAATVVVSTDLFLGTSDGWSNARLLETGIILDLTIFLPALYYWCYRSRGKVAVLRAVSLSCLGLWVAAFIVPSEHQILLSEIGFIRYIGLAVLLAIQFKLIVMLYRAAFHPDRDANVAALATVKEEGMPDWVARILAWEASMWRKAWDTLQRWVGRD